MKNWIEIFKVPARKGDVQFTAADYDGILRNFKPGEPALVFGHPKTEDPAYGSVSELKVDGPILSARFQDVAAGVPELVRSKRYRDRSVRLRPQPDGTYKLIHVGLLGAVPPAIEGLAPLQFDAGDDDLDFTFEEEKPMQITQEQLDAKVAEEVKKAEEKAALDFAAERTALAEQLAEERARNHRADLELRVERRLAGGLPPALSVGLVDFMATLPHEDVSALDFAADGEDATKTVKLTPLAFFERHLDQLKTIDFAATATRKTDPAETKKDGDTTTTAPLDFGLPADEEMEGAAEAAEALQISKAEGISYVDALSRVYKART